MATGWVLLHHPTQVPFAEIYNLVEAFLPDRPDDALAVTALPWGAWCGDDLPDARSISRMCSSMVADIGLVR